MRLLIPAPVSRPVSRVRLLGVVVLALWTVCGPFGPFSDALRARAWAITILRDAETESFLRQFGAPLVRAAGLDAERMRYYLVADPTPNAFVHGGNGIFVHAGLVTLLSDPDALLGVIAHELAHLAQGDVAGIHLDLVESQRHAGITALAGVAGGLLLGGAIPIATILGVGVGVTGAQRGVYASVRLREVEADRQALAYMRAANYPSEGLVRALEALDRHQHLEEDETDLMRTHPVTTSRIAALRRYIQADASSPPPEHMPAPIREAYGLIVHKLRAYMMGPSQGARSYRLVGGEACAGEASGDPHDLCVQPSFRYGRAVVAVRAGRSGLARRELDALRGRMPEHPYFWELSGELALLQGDKSGAVENFGRAYGLRPSSELLRFRLAEALFHRGGEEDLSQARSHFERVARAEPGILVVWRRLAEIAARRGERGTVYLMRAEEAYHGGLFGRAINFARQAEQTQEEDVLLRARDIQDVAEASRRNR